MTTYVLMIFIYTVSGGVETESAYFYSLKRCEEGAKVVSDINKKPEVKEIITVCLEE